MFGKYPHYDDREIKCLRNFQNLPLAKFAKINVRENLCSRKLMLAKYNVLKVDRFNRKLITSTIHLFGAVLAA